MNSIDESQETDNDKSSEPPVNQGVMESPPTTGRVTSQLSALDKLRNAAKKAAMVKAWSRAQNSDQKAGEEKKETEVGNQPVVRFKSQEDPPQPVSSRTPRTPRKILVHRESANKRDKETARLISAINREKAKAKEAIQNKAKYNKEHESKKLKEKEPCDEKDVERKKSGHVRLFGDNRQPEPEGSKFFRTIMKRKFGTAGVGYTFNSLLDSASFRDTGKTIAGSTSGHTETFLTCGESVMDMYSSTCVESMVGSSSARTSKRAPSLPRPESAVRPRTSLSRCSLRNDEISSRRHKTKSASQSTKQVPKKNPTISSKAVGEGEPSGNEQKPTYEDDEGIRYILTIEFVPIFVCDVSEFTKLSEISVHS